MTRKRSASKGRVEFTNDLLACLIIRKIVTRALALGSEHRIGGLDRLSLTMDISATHVTCPLRLHDLLAADDCNFIHDVFGIRRHLDRKTGELGDCFLPRFAISEAHVSA